MTGERGSAGDVIQEVFSGLTFLRNRFERGTNCRAWLYKILFHCVSHHRSRKFVHLTFRNETNLLSLVIARKNTGESLRSGDMLPALTQSGIAMYAVGAERFRIAAFEGRDYFAVYGPGRKTST